MTHPPRSSGESLSEGDAYRAMHDAAIAAYEAATPSGYRYSATALRRAVDAALASRPSHPTGGVELDVKPLRWESVESMSEFAAVREWWCMYRITLRTDGQKQLRLEWIGNRNDDLGIFLHWDQAKVAARTDYEARIRPLYASPPPDVGIKEGVKPLEWVREPSGLAVATIQPDPFSMLEISRRAGFTVNLTIHTQHEDAGRWEDMSIALDDNEAAQLAHALAGIKAGEGVAVTDEMVEVAAKVLWANSLTVINWDAACEIAATQPGSSHVSAVKSFRNAARAALTAALQTNGRTKP